VGDSPLAGTLAIGFGALSKEIAIAARAPGSKRVASALPALLTRIGSRRRGDSGCR